MKTIAQMLRDFLVDDRIISNVGGRITGDFIIKLMKVNDESLDNYIIFDNAGGNAFDIRVYNESYINLEKFKADATIHLKPYVYAYKINGIETIVKPFPKH